MARAGLALAVLAVLAVAGSADVASREEPGGRTAVAAPHVAIGGSQLASVLVHPRRVGRPSSPCFREGSGPCVPVCAYLARVGQSVTPGCPATAPAGCVHFIATRVRCAPSSATDQIVLAPRAIPHTAVLVRPRLRPGGP